MRDVSPLSNCSGLLYAFPLLFFLNAVDHLLPIFVRKSEVGLLAHGNFTWMSSSYSIVLHLWS